jgi:hypothetical protein
MDTLCKLNVEQINELISENGELITDSAQITYFQVINLRMKMKSRDLLENKLHMNILRVKIII